MAKGLLFDFDGTLYGDWRIWISIIGETLADFQVTIDPHDALKKARMIIENQGGRDGTLRVSGVATAMARDRGLDEDDKIRARFFEILDARMDKTGPERSLVRMLRKFSKSGLHMGIVTFVRKPRISRRLELWKLKDFFGSVISPEDEPEFKPSPKPFLKAMDELQVPPQECFVIGDEPVDMIGGKKAGAMTIGLPRGFFTKEELEVAGADEIISSLELLPNIVSK